MSKLIYHSESQIESPFDKAIVDAVHDSKVLIACPFISLAYFRRVNELSTDWKIVTDMQQLCRSTPKDEREQLQQFLRANMRRIRNLDGLHAKAVVGQNSAFFGSANLTISGICANTELGIVVCDKNTLEELRNWFDVIWAQAQEIEYAFIGKCVSLPYSGPKRNKKDVKHHSFVDISPLRLRDELPSQAELFWPIREVMRQNGGVITSQELYAELKRKMRLSPKALAKRISTGRGTEPKFHNDVRYAIEQMEDVERVSRGKYRLKRWQ